MKPMTGQALPAFASHPERGGSEFSAETKNSCAFGGVNL